MKFQGCRLADVSYFEVSALIRAPLKGVLKRIYLRLQTVFKLASACSIQLRARLFNDLRPFDDFLAHVLGELVGRLD